VEYTLHTHTRSIQAFEHGISRYLVYLSVYTPYLAIYPVPQT